LSRKLIDLIQEIWRPLVFVAHGLGGIVLKEVRERIETIPVGDQEAAGSLMTV